MHIYIYIYIYICMCTCTVHGYICMCCSMGYIFKDIPTSILFILIYIYIHNWYFICWGLAERPRMICAE